MGLIYFIRISKGKGQPWTYSILKRVSLDHCRTLLMRDLPRDANAKGEIYKAKDEDLAYMRRVHKNADYRELMEEVIMWRATKCDSAKWVPDRKMYKFETGKYGSY